MAMRYAASLVAIGAALCLGGVVTADVTSHNGIGSGDPNPVDVVFSETHNTAFANFPVFDFVPVSGTHFDKTFNDIQRHNLAYEYAEVYSPLGLVFPMATPDSIEPLDGLGMAVTEVVTNNDTAGKLWGGYRFGLESADVYVPCAGFCEQFGGGNVVDLFALQESTTTRDVLVSDVGFTTLAGVGNVSILISQDPNAGNGPIVELTFENPLLVGESFDLDYLVNYAALPNGIVTTGFTLFQEPIEFNPIPAPGAAILAVIGFGFVGSIRRRFC